MWQRTNEFPLKVLKMKCRHLLFSLAALSGCSTVNPCPLTKQDSTIKPYVHSDIQHPSNNALAGQVISGPIPATPIPYTFPTGDGYGIYAPIVEYTGHNYISKDSKNIVGDTDFTLDCGWDVDPKTGHSHLNGYYALTQITSVDAGHASARQIWTFGDKIVAVKVLPANTKTGQSRVIAQVTDINTSDARANNCAFDPAGAGTFSDCRDIPPFAIYAKLLTNLPYLTDACKNLWHKAYTLDHKSMREQSQPTGFYNTPARKEYFKSLLENIAVLTR